MKIKHKILVLAGTYSARALCQVLGARQDIRVTASFKSTVQQTAPFGVPVRCGGFGGSEGLRLYLRQNRISAMVDATHPFAEEIKKNAIAAAKAENLPFIHLTRPGWSKPFDNAWKDCGDLLAVLDGRPAGENVFWAAGVSYLQDLASRSQLKIFLRAIRPPSYLQPNLVHVPWKPAISLNEERDLFHRFNIGSLFCKNSGGAQGFAKIEAALAAGIPVFVKKRPDLPVEFEKTEKIEAVVAWLDQTLSSLDNRMTLR